ncbi:MAG: cell division protein ZipA C-terminal FtsZ-binding domain-containing protein [Gammaproteobacteria bacterium]
MDKDLLRLVIIGIGFFFITVMILWHIFGGRKSRYHIDFLDEKNTLDNIDKRLIINTENDDFDIVPIGPAVKNEASDTQKEPNTKKSIPDIIQFGIVAKSDEGFNGEILDVAFNSVGLQYSDMNIYQKLNDDGQVAYLVANMVEPGTFPQDDLADFSTPGIVFFMQPHQVANKIEAFDNLVATVNHLSSLLNGIEWDGNRQPLTIETVQALRDVLE